MTTALFKKLVNGTEALPKPVVREPKVKVTTDRMQEIGYVMTATGWVHESAAVRLPQGGKFVWVAF